jgi:nitroreductase
VDISQFEALLRSRRSVRDFRPDPVPDELLRAVIADAVSAPSWSNTQPYRLAVATGATRDRIAGALTETYDLAAQLLAAPDSDVDIPLTYPDDLQPQRRATGFGLYEVLGIARDDRESRNRQMRRNYEFFGAPAAIFVFVHSGLGLYSVLDAGFMLENLVLSAHARGLGTCAQGALAMWSGPVRAEFEVPDEYLLVCGVSIGYPSDHAVNAYNPGRSGVDAIVLPTRAD